MLKCSGFKPDVELPLFPVPKHLIQAAEYNFSLNKLCQLSQDFYEHLKVNKVLRPSTYKKVMELLLQTEDAYIWNSYKKYTQSSVKFSEDGNIGSISVCYLILFVCDIYINYLFNCS